MTKNVEHSSEKTPRELMKGFTNLTPVISTHFVDQVQIFFSFLRTALLLRLDSNPTVNSRTYRHLDWIRKRRSRR